MSFILSTTKLPLLPLNALCGQNSKLLKVTAASSVETTVVTRAERILSIAYPICLVSRAVEFCIVDKIPYSLVHGDEHLERTYFLHV
jgi:hypothetical protein